jgi:class 3 adenylate cyclase/predicted metal-dependent HD superfamily phosphohydrolase
MLFLAEFSQKTTFLHSLSFNFSKESYFNFLVFILISLIIGYIIRVNQIKSNQRKLSFLVDKRTKLISKQKDRIERQNKIVKQQKDQSDELLLNVLPTYIVKELKEQGKVSIKTYENVSVMFIDIVGFSKIAERIDPKFLVNKLNKLFSEFDKIIEKHGLEKIKTIGDAYLAVAGLGVGSKTNPIKCVSAALEIQNLMLKVKEEPLIENNDENWTIRIGIHTGEVITGVLGTKRIAYDIFGNTVNIAERMEANCEPDKVNISEDTYNCINIFYECTNRGEIATKNTGDINMFFVNSVRNPFKEKNNFLFNRWSNDLIDFYAKSNFDFLNLKSFGIKHLENNLSSSLYYHGSHHTLDVLQSLNQICFYEKLKPADFFNLKAAVLFHDMGYIDQYENNENTGVKYAQKHLPDYGYSKIQIEKISELILATKVPQKPKNKLEKIICDADLDYLGREDFIKISDNFYRELKENKIIKNKKEWDQIQIKFIENHNYFTDFSIINREKQKQIHLQLIKNRSK